MLVFIIDLIIVNNSQNYRWQMWEITFPPLMYLYF